MVETRTRFVGTSSPNRPPRLNTLSMRAFSAHVVVLVVFEVYTHTGAAGGGGEKEKYLRKTSCINARATLPSFLLFFWYFAA